MKFLAITLAALALYEIFALLQLRKHRKILDAAVSSCDRCGAGTVVTPDPPNSQLMVQCQAADCGHVFSRPVRASALSLFGVTQLVLVLLAGAVGYGVVAALEGDSTGRVLAAFACCVFGFVVVRFLIRALAFTLLQRKLSPSWQEEIVAYLAPPPFMDREETNP